MVYTHYLYSCITYYNGGAVVAGQLKFGFVTAAAVHNSLTYLFRSLADTHTVQHHNDHPFNKLSKMTMVNCTVRRDLWTSSKVYCGGGVGLVYYYYYYYLIRYL